MFAKINSAALNGLKAISVTLEVNAFLTKGGDGTESTFFMVGLPDNAVRESKQRVLSALANSAFRLPRMNVTVNLAPADIRKEGSGFDLPLAVGLLKTTDIVKADRLDDVAFVGELGLDGTIRSVRGALPIAIEARKQGFKALFVPKANEREAGVVNHLKVYGVKTLKEVVDALNGNLSLTPVAVNTRADFYAAQTTYPLDFAEVKGQVAAKRAFDDRRLARMRQEHDGKTPPLYPTPTDFGGELGDYADLLHCGRTAGRDVAHSASAFSQSAPHHIRRRPDWRRHDAAPRRDFAGPHRRSFLRRSPRV